MDRHEIDRLASDGAPSLDGLASPLWAIALKLTDIAVALNTANIQREEARAAARARSARELRESARQWGHIPAVRSVDLSEAMVEPDVDPVAQEDEDEHAHQRAHGPGQ